MYELKLTLLIARESADADVRDRSPSGMSARFLRNQTSGERACSRIGSVCGVRGRLLGYLSRDGRGQR